MNDLNPQDDELYVPNDLPPAILDALRQLDGPMPMPDANRRERVLAEAREHFADIRQGQRRRLIFRFAAAGTALATAAAIAIVVYIGGPATNNSAAPNAFADTTTPPAITGDANRDGTIDAGDMLNLGQALARGETPAGSDINNDGVFNQRDIDAVAALAVDLDLERGVELSTLAPTKRGFFAVIDARTDRGGEQ